MIHEHRAGAGGGAVVQKTIAGRGEQTSCVGVRGRRAAIAQAWTLVASGRLLKALDKIEALHRGSAVGVVVACIQIRAAPFVTGDGAIDI